MNRDWIVQALGGADSFARLASGLPATDLWSALMEVARERARARTPAQLLDQWRRDAFVIPAVTDQRTQLAVDAELLAAASAFDAIELSPVAPLATCSAVALTDQHRVLTALRGTEVVSDPTNVLALESAVRLAARPTEPIRFATCQRVVRAQQVPKKPGFAQHFRIFVLTTAGRETKDHAFSVAALAEHVRTMVAGLDRLEATGHYSFGKRRLDLLSTKDADPIATRLADSLSGAIELARKPLEHPYYSGGVRYMLWVTAPDDREEVPLIDGGLFDWMARLTSNRRNVLAASGIGAQLVPVRFRRIATERRSP